MYHPISTMSSTPKLACVNYVDHKSVNQTALMDLSISFTEQVVGSNLRRLSTFGKHDWVIVCAKSNNHRMCFIAEIIDRLEGVVDTWLTRGGCTWTHNFRVRSLTGITDITTKSDSRNRLVDTLRDFWTCDHKYARDHLNMFFSHIRCSYRYQTPLQHMIQHGLFAPSPVVEPMEYTMIQSHETAIDIYSSGNHLPSLITQTTLHVPDSDTTTEYTCPTILNRAWSSAPNTLQVVSACTII